jgi:hypothetical protein
MSEARVATLTPYTASSAVEQVVLRRNRIKLILALRCQPVRSKEDSVTIRVAGVFLDQDVVLA